jgi:hypothetical protein
MSGINYRFNEWKQTGEPAEVWSPMSYRLISKNVQSQHFNGFKVGHILYLYHVKGMTAQEIKKHPGEAQGRTLCFGFVHLKLRDFSFIRLQNELVIVCND